MTDSPRARFDYGTARGWARLGLLYAQGGVWQGERLLPEGFAQFAGSVAPAWSEPVYGGLFWVNGTSKFHLPTSAFWAQGAGGQYTIVDTANDLVVVRMGHQIGALEGTDVTSLNGALRLLPGVIRGFVAPSATPSL
jgi:CubicO group peptidase (beta-lactamase class C family)